MALVRQVSEREADGEVERVYHELRQVLRVTGVDVSLRAWAAFPRFFVAMWDALRPDVETRAFEEAADSLRDEALEAAADWEALGAWDAVTLGPSQRFHVKGVLELYGALQPKVLLMASAVRMALTNEPVGLKGIPGTVERVERGVPSRMAAMEWVLDRPDDPRLRTLFSDVVRHVGPPAVPGEYRALGLWPEYLEAAWGRLKQRLVEDTFAQAAEALRQSARQQARALPYAVALSRERVEALGEDAAAVFRVTDALERRLPMLLLNLAQLVLDAPEVERHPFPAASRLVPDWVVAEELR
ncbi:halocarboxylic acid dehydrogenase DehI family protein [Pyxidicoccus xibeiensis]|uniref:halocarboxylic acid dehydrogenase DehI family protein n=1 Tax=Pyxidicoccus xibeiensis TaxID=2906759 RepID=UPI0020A73510|nr:halocarboxylic acid dehydrogenase DehI family protein [Pyxidicoccus xibeiensis]MCP3136883.1 halocarboxylic acid dehydrogenase DehI family protein [Pyxidicoccus xibeiensis]